MSKRYSATVFDFFFFFFEEGGGLSGAKMVIMARHVNGGETCGTVLQYWQAESVKYDNSSQKSPYFALTTKVWTFTSQWLPNIFLCVQGWTYYLLIVINHWNTSGIERNGFCTENGQAIRLDERRSLWRQNVQVQDKIPLQSKNTYKFNLEPLCPLNEPHNFKGGF